MKANKKLSEMSNEELWHLFPIVLTEHNDSWKILYREEEKRIRSFLQFDGMYISHIGSTSIDGIWAKPIVDILLEIPQNTPIEIIKGYLLNNGYLCMAEAGDDVVPYFLLKELKKGYLDGVMGVYHTPKGYFVDEKEAAKFDTEFPPKEKLKLPGQLV